jgi:cytochrome c6
MIACLRKLRLHGSVKASHLVVLGVMTVSPLTQAQTAANPETAESLFKTNCALCHGDDGSGTELGKRFHVKDLRTKEVQDKSSADLAQIIRDGKNNMPAFGKRLNDDQIQKLVDYIRHLVPTAH